MNNASRKQEYAEPALAKQWLVQSQPPKLAAYASSHIVTFVGRTRLVKEFT
jgi:hypothetical protein